MGPCCSTRKQAVSFLVSYGGIYHKHEISSRGRGVMLFAKPTCSDGCGYPGPHPSQDPRSGWIQSPIVAA